MATEKKSRYTEAQAKASKKYLAANYEDIKVRLPKGKRDYYKQAAANANESLNSFVIRAMDYLIRIEELDKENKTSKSKKDK